MKMIGCLGAAKNTSVVGPRHVSPKFSRVSDFALLVCFARNSFRHQTTNLSRNRFLVQGCWEIVMNLNVFSHVVMSGVVALFASGACFAQQISLVKA